MKESGWKNHVIKKKKDKYDFQNSECYSLIAVVILGRAIWNSVRYWEHRPEM